MTNLVQLNLGHNQIESIPVLDNLLQPMPEQALSSFEDEKKQGSRPSEDEEPAYKQPALNKRRLILIGNPIERLILICNPMEREVLPQQMRDSEHLSVIFSKSF